MSSNVLHRVWRRFVPQVKSASAPQTGTVFEQADALLAQLNVKDINLLEPLIDRQKTQAGTDPAANLVLLILQAPRAATAQAAMDKHPHGFAHREKRLFELIDFNDTFVTTVLLFPEAELAEFTHNLQVRIDDFCQSLHNRTFTPEQFEAITHGLSREIAVYHAAKHRGLEVVMTSRTADAFGIDMQIRNSTTDRYINLDCKTSSSFHFRLMDLVHDGRIAPHDMLAAESKGYWEIVNRGKGKHARIMLFRVAQEEFGEIRAFTFLQEAQVARRLETIIAERGLVDGRFGEEF